MTNEQTHNELWQLFTLCCKLSPNLAKYPTIRTKLGYYKQITEPYSLKPNKRKFNYDFVHLLSCGKSYIYHLKGEIVSRMFQYFFECEELVLERIERAEKDCKRDKDNVTEILEKCYKSNLNTIQKYEKKIRNLV